MPIKKLLKKPLKKQGSKQLVAILAVIGIGIVLALLILRTEAPQDAEEGHEHAQHADESLNSSAVEDRHEHTPQPPETAKGPHGGKLFTENGYGVELTLFEQNESPEFRVYTYRNNRLLDPAGSSLTMRLQRLGSQPQLISFVKENDYLKSKATIEEPHSFKVDITAEHEHKQYRFAYEQVEARVKITDKQLTLNSIEVLTAAPAKIKSTLHLQGEIKLNADKSVHVVPRVGGIVESVNANAGDTVRKGQMLASLSSQAIAGMRSDLLTAQKKVDLARLTFKREQQLWQDKVSAEQDYLQARHDLQEAEIDASRAQQKLAAIGAGVNAKGQARYEIRSPIDGVITNKQISQGQVVTETDDIFEVADLSTVWAEMVIYAKDINTVKLGQKVTVKATAFDAQAPGVIAYVGALVGQQSRTAMARVVLDNAGKTWLPGLPVNIELVAEEAKVPLAVSVEGLQSLRDWTVVFGRYGEYFEARPLKLGRRDDQYAEVLDGINIGDKYAAGNSFLIKADIGKAGASHDH